MSKFYDDERPQPTPAEGVRILGAEEARAGLGAHEAEPEPPDEPRFDFEDEPADALPADDISTVRESADPDLTTGEVPPLPHWTEPATGAVPAIFADDNTGEHAIDDDLEAWAPITGSTPRFRAEGSDWAEADFGEDLSGDQDRLGALSEAEPVDEEEDVRRRLGQREPIGGLQHVGAERLADGGDDVPEPAMAVCGLDEPAHAPGLI